MHTFTYWYRTRQTHWAKPEKPVLLAYSAEHAHNIPVDYILKVVLIKLIIFNVLHQKVPIIDLLILVYTYKKPNPEKQTWKWIHASQTKRSSKRMLTYCICGHPNIGRQISPWPIDYLKTTMCVTLYLNNCLSVAFKTVTVVVRPTWPLRLS